MTIVARQCYSPLKYINQMLSTQSVYLGEQDLLCFLQNTLEGNTSCSVRFRKMSCHVFLPEVILLLLKPQICLGELCKKTASSFLNLATLLLMYQLIMCR